MSDTLAAHGVEVLHNFGGGVYAKETRIPEGVSLLQHSHPHDHLSILASGAAMVRVEGKEEMKTGPCCLTIKAGSKHEVVALSDVVWYCVHATEETDPEKVDTAILE